MGRVGWTRRACDFLLCICISRENYLDGIMGKFYYFGFLIFFRFKEALTHRQILIWFVHCHTLSD